MHKAFSIRLDGSVLVGELPELAMSAPVVRTPHLGNLYPADLALLSLGIPVRLLDKNYSVVDRLYLPEARITDGKATLLSQQHGVLAPYLSTSAGEAVVSGHYRAMQAAVPGSVVSTYSRDYLESIDLVEAVLETLAEIRPDMFSRLCLEDGRVVPLDGINGSTVSYRSPECGVIRVARQELAARCIRYFEHVAVCLDRGVPMYSGGHVLIRAEADLLLQGLIGAGSAGGGECQRVYQCCGIAMGRYATDPRRDMAAGIEDIYRRVKRHTSGNKHALPAIEMILIPTSMLRLVYINPERNSLHRKILDCEERWLALRQGKGEAIRQAAGKHRREQIIDRYQVLFQQVRNERQAHIDAQVKGKWPPFYALGDSNRFTQYDLAASGEGIAIPGDVLDMPVGSLGPRIRKMLSAHPRLRQAVFE